MTELVERLGVVAALDAAMGPVKSRGRGFTAGQVLVGVAAAQMVGEDFLVGWTGSVRMRRGRCWRQRRGWPRRVRPGLARRVDERQWAAVEQGVATATPVRGSGGRTWPPGRSPGVVLAADLLAGDVDPRPGRRRLPRRALAALPAATRGGGVRTRAGAGYLAGQLARAAHAEGIGFAIGAKRTAPLWRTLAGLGEAEWADAVDMAGAQVAVAGYCPDWWPADTRPLIRRVRLDPAAVHNGHIVGEVPMAGR
ncbi:MAG TPA: hypothetical protein VLJ59_19505 [Mycobacteriales bacterium]|nr:hypothetical protein [Mycobacteriales bacterium]